MTAFVNVSNVWKTVAAAYTRVSGSWESHNIDVNVGAATPKAVHRDVVVSISNANVSDIQFSSLATAEYSLENDGDIIEGISTGPTDTGDWITPTSAAGSGYEVRATLDSGSLDSGTTGSWLSLGTTRTWGVAAASTPSSQSASLTIEIRDASSLVVLDSATVNLSADNIV